VSGASPRRRTEKSKRRRSALHWPSSALDDRLRLDRTQEVAGSSPASSIVGTTAQSGMSRLSSQSRPRRGQAASSRISPRTSLLPALVRRSTASRPGRDAGSAPHASISASTTGCQASASSEASPAASLTAPDAGTEDPSRRDRTPRHLSAGTRGGRTRWPATRGCEERDAAERRSPRRGIGCAAADAVPPDS
jgi:hypothetical protein